MAKLIIGMDISLDSTGIVWGCGSKIGYVSILNSYKITTDKKKLDDEERKIREHVVLNGIHQAKTPVTNFSLKFYKRKASSVKSSDLQTWHKEHMTFITEKADIVSSILCAVNKMIPNDGVEICLEYYSYGSISKGGSASVQIIECTSAIKQKIVLSGVCKLENISVIPGPIIKKFAGGGSFEKFDMLQAYLELKLVDDPFYKFVKDNYSSLYKVKVSGKGSKTEQIVEKPIDDIIDAFWVQRYASSHSS